MFKFFIVTISCHAGPITTPLRVVTDVEPVVNSASVGKAGKGTVTVQGKGALIQVDRADCDVTSESVVRY